MKEEIMNEEEMSWKDMTEAEKIESTKRSLIGLWVCFIIWAIITAPVGIITLIMIFT